MSLKQSSSIVPLLLICIFLCGGVANETTLEEDTVSDFKNLCLDKISNSGDYSRVETLMKKSQYSELSEEKTAELLPPDRGKAWELPLRDKRVVSITDAGICSMFPLHKVSWEEFIEVFDKKIKKKHLLSKQSEPIIRRTYAVRHYTFWDGKKETWKFVVKISFDKTKNSLVLSALPYEIAIKRGIELSVFDQELVSEGPRAGDFIPEFDNLCLGYYKDYSRLASFVKSREYVRISKERTAELLQPTHGIAWSLPGTEERILGITDLGTCRISFLYKLPWEELIKVFEDQFWDNKLIDKQDGFLRRRTYAVRRVISRIGEKETLKVIIKITFDETANTLVLSALPYDTAVKMGMKFPIFDREW